MQIVFLGQFVRQHRAAYERDYLAIGVLKLYDMIIKILAYHMQSPLKNFIRFNMKFMIVRSRMMYWIGDVFGKMNIRLIVSYIYIYDNAQMRSQIYITLQPFLS